MFSRTGIHLQNSYRDWVRRWWSIIVCRKEFENFYLSAMKNIVNWTFSIWNWQKCVENSLSGCKSGWLAFKDPSSGDVQCYLFVNEQELDWTQAENFCTNFAGFPINCVFKLKSNKLRLCFDKLRFGLFKPFPSLEHLEIQFIFYWNLEWHLNE